MPVSFLRRPSVLLALALCSVGGVVTLLGHLAGGPRAEQKTVPLVSEAGAKAYPALSPDGQRIAYAARAGKSDTFHIFVRAVGVDTPRQVTTGEAGDVSPAWSPDGNRIAFLRIEEGRAQYIVLPAGGGEERRVAEFSDERGEAQPPPAVVWTPEGKSLIVADTGRRPAGLSVVAIDTGAVAPLTHPQPGAVDSTPVISPDHTTLAFVRSSGEGSGDIFLADLQGQNIRRLTFDDHGIFGIAWAADSQDVVYGTNRSAGRSQLWRVPAYGGSPRMLAFAGLNASFPAIAGSRLVYEDSPSASTLWRARLNGEDDAEEQELVRSTGRESWPAYSPDGRRIAYISDQTGADEVWICDAAGGNREQVTHFNRPRVARPRWSPDGRYLLISHDGSRGPGLYTIMVPAKGVAPLNGNRPVSVVPGGTNGSWSRDGKKVYYDAGGKVWRMAVGGGPSEEITSEEGTAQGIESLDGKYVYFRSRRGIWRVPAAGGKAEEVFVPEHDMPFTTLQPAKNGLYYLEWEHGAHRFAISFYDLSKKKSSVMLRVKGSNLEYMVTSYSYSVSPDGTSIVYPRLDRSETNLMLVEHFR